MPLILGATVSVTEAPTVQENTSSSSSAAAAAVVVDDDSSGPRGSTAFHTRAIIFGLFVAVFVAGWW